MRTKPIPHAVRRFAALASVGLLVACSTPTPEPNYYLMRGEVSDTSGRIDGNFRTGLGKIVVAPYLLTSQGLVLETAPGEVRAARQHQWAEPFDAGLRWFLRGEIARELGFEVGGGLFDRKDWDFTIDVYIARLHGTMSGTAILEAFYAIRPADAAKRPLEFRFASSRALTAEGYPALVAAEQRLIGELGASIASSLRELMAPGGSPPGE